MRITVTIDCENAAFEDANMAPETARILRELADRLAEELYCDRRSPRTIRLRDINGNTVGKCEVTGE